MNKRNIGHRGRTQSRTQESVSYGCVLPTALAAVLRCSVCVGHKILCPTSVSYPYVLHFVFAPQRVNAPVGHRIALTHVRVRARAGTRESACVRNASARARYVDNRILYFLIDSESWLEVVLPFV